MILRNQFYGLIVTSEKLLRASRNHLPIVFRELQRQSANGPTAEVKIWKWPLSEADKDHLVHRCNERHWSVDLFFETKSAIDGIKTIIEGPQFRHVHFWLLPGPFDDYPVVYSQVLFLHVVRVLAGDAEDVSKHPLLWQYLERAPISEAVPEPPAMPVKVARYETVLNALLAAEDGYPKDLVVTKDAKASAENYGNDDSQTERTYQALVALGRIASAMKPGNQDGPPGAGVGQMLKEVGFSYESKDADVHKKKLKAYCCGKEIICWEHVRIGSGFAQCIRIHFGFCPRCAKCVIQHCGDHL